MSRSLLVGLICVGAWTVSAQNPELESRARLILEKRCVTCHNPELKTSSLVLSTREGALKGGSRGVPALVPSHPEQSLLLQRIGAGEMPPGNPLPPEERDILREWIQAGAPWSSDIVRTPSARPRAGPDWWSLQPLRAVQAPDTAGLPAHWARSPIDRLIYARLKEKGLEPAPPADRRTFVRRATLDLLGLPPTPEEVEAFVGDRREDAYEKLIDRLLASPHYGERWGRHWLDVVRFGESHGYEQNHLRDQAWHYRDYVIRSFNEDKPFTRMIVEQIAADQLAPNDPAVEVATGFLVAGVHDTVGIANIEGELQKRANDLDDMVATTAQAFLGLTVHCARCHDHKFDPIAQADYYRMQASFAGVQHGERELVTAEERKRHRVLKEPLSKKLEAVKLWIEALKIQGEPRVEQRREEIAARYRPPINSQGTEERFSPVRARFVRMTILETYNNGPPALDELEIWTDGFSPVNTALASRGAKASARATRSDGAGATFYHVEYLNDAKFDNVWICAERGTGQVAIELPSLQTISRIVWSRDRLGANQGRHLNMVPTQYVFEVSDDGRQWRKLIDSSDRLPYSEAEREELFLLAVLTEEEQKEWQDLKRRKKELEEQLAAVPKLPTAYLGIFKQPEEATQLNRRGNPMDKGEIVAPGSLTTLKPILPEYVLDPKAPEGERRLALARWIADDRNALTARVLANRLWHYHFGRGLVATPSDFGFNGERPSHPELLEWLAARVIELGWRLKPLHREIMLSATYRQSARHDARLAQIDSEAHYLWRFPPRRLDGEAVRDAVLTVSGMLDRTFGGPGFRLYKYTVDNVATYYALDTFGKETFRRSLYHQAARSVKVDLLGPFDCPDSTLPAPKRVVTTSPLQALSLQNNSFMIDQARFMAERLLRDVGSDPAAQVQRAYLLAFGRPVKPQELDAALELIGRHGLFVFCRALFNTNEFVYVM